MTTALEERENSAALCDELARKLERSALKLRVENTRKRRWPLGGSFVVPSAERNASAIDAAAHSLRTVSRMILSGVRAEKGDGLGRIGESGISR